jgi:ribokinase
VTDPPNIWVVGSTNVDLVSTTARIPRVGETVLGEHFSLGFGGKGANQAVMASRLGADVTFVGRVGADLFGDMTLANLRRERIDLAHLVRDTQALSGVAQIWVEPDGANRIVCVPGANEELDPKEVECAISRAARVDLVIGQLEIPQQVTAAAFRAAAARGATTVLNPAPAAPLDEALLGATDWLIPNEVEFSAIARERADALAPGVVARAAVALGVRLVVTLGAQGAVLQQPDGIIAHIPAPRVAAVDTTGAGDAFVGAFSTALASGTPELEAVRLGCACASESVTRPGAQSSFPER